MISPAGDRFLLTGDALLLAGCGRTDLGGHPVAWTDLLFRSLHTTLPELVTDETLIMPSSSMGLAEVRADGIVAAPFARIRATHPGLQASSPAELLPRVQGRSTDLPAAIDTMLYADLGLRQLNDDEIHELETDPSHCVLAR